MSTLFSGHYLRNRSTLDIGVLGYIGIVQHKEHSPEVLSIPPGTPCIRAEIPQTPQELRACLGLCRNCLTLYFIHLDSYVRVSLWFTCDKILYLWFERNSHLSIEKVQ